MILLKGHRRPIWALAFSPDGSTLASSADGGLSVFLWDLAAGKKRTSLPQGPVTALAFTPDGQTLATGSAGVTLWDPATGEKKVTLDQGTSAAGAVEALTFTRDGRLLAAANDWSGGYGINHQVLCWEDPGAGGAATAWRFPSGWPSCRALSPDGKLLAAGSGIDVRLYPLGKARGRRVLPTLSHDKPVYALAFSPDARTLAVATGWGVALWDTAKWRRLGVLSGHRRLVWDVTFSPDGRMLLSCSHDKSVRLWDVAGRRELGAFDWDVGRVYAGAFASDGMRAAAGGEGKIALWDVE